MKTFTAATGHPVVAAGSAEHIGDLEGFVLDGSATKVAGIRVGRGRHAQVIAWNSVQGFGEDAVVASAPSEGGEGNEALSGRPEVIGALVLSTSGFELGEVSDIEFDESSGDVLSVLAGAASIDVGRIRSLGSYAMVVDPEA